MPSQFYSKHTEIRSESIDNLQLKFISSNCYNKEHQNSNAIRERVTS